MVACHCFYWQCRHRSLATAVSVETKTSACFKSAEMPQAHSLINVWKFTPALGSTRIRTHLSRASYEWWRRTTMSSCTGLRWRRLATQRRSSSLRRTQVEVSPAPQRRNPPLTQAMNLTGLSLAQCGHGPTWQSPGEVQSPVPPGAPGPSL